LEGLLPSILQLVLFAMIKKGHFGLKRAEVYKGIHGLKCLRNGHYLTPQLIQLLLLLADLLLVSARLLGNLVFSLNCLELLVVVQKFVEVA